MKIIAEAKPAILKAWGRQAKKDGIYRKMRYVLETKCNEGVLLYNMVTGELVLLTPEEEAFWQQLPGQPPEVLSSLLEKHYLVPENANEYNSVNTLRRLMNRLTVDKDVTNFTILPTTGCNARCFYCYESSFPRQTMSRETAEDVVRYICRSRGSKEKVKLNWFGGEPMVAWPRIRQICQRLEETGLGFTSTMVSNGYLFTPELVKEAKELWNLQEIQISLDGTEEVYNKTKSYVGVSGSPYQKVMENIDLLLAEKIDVALRMNIGLHNADDLSSLIDELALRFAGRDQLTSYVFLLFEKDGFGAVPHTETERAVLRRLQSALNDHIREKGLRSSFVSGKLKSMDIVFCIADSPNSVIITPKGELTKCVRRLFEGPFGNIRDGITDISVWNKWLHPEVHEVCKRCSLYPVCASQSNCPSLNPCSPDRAEQELSFRLQNMLLTYQKKTADSGKSAENPRA